MSAYNPVALYQQNILTYGISFHAHDPVVRGDWDKVRIIWRLINDSIWMGDGEATLFLPSVLPCQRASEPCLPACLLWGLLYPHLRVGSTCCQMGLTAIERTKERARGMGFHRSDPSPRRCNACPRARAPCVHPLALSRPPDVSTFQSPPPFFPPVTSFSEWLHGCPGPIEYNFQIWTILSKS